MRGDNESRNEKLFVCRYDVSGGTIASIEMTALVPLCSS